MASRINVVKSSISGDEDHNYNIINHHFANQPPSISKELFEEQEEVTYKEAIDLFLNRDCCAGVRYIYDDISKQWRTAVFIRQFSKSKRILLRFITEPKNQCVFSNYFTLKDFPVKIIMNNPDRFKVIERDLKCFSNVPLENINEWKIYQKQFQLSKNKNIKLIFGYFRVKQNQSKYIIPKLIINITAAYYLLIDEWNLELKNKYFQT